MAEKKKIISPYEGFQEKFVRSNVDFVIGGGAVSAGKLNPIYTSVLTTKGWRKIGDLKVGDKIVTIGGIHGKITAVKDEILEIDTGALNNRSSLKISRWAVKECLTVKDDE